MRVGQNPAKSIKHVARSQRVTVAVVTYIPFLHGFYTQSLEVLKACLDSLWQNTQIAYDLLIFDNASCADVRAYLSSVHQQGKIQYLIFSEKNIGKGGAWNFIFQAAPGEIIAYADSDISFASGWLTESLKILDSFPKTGMVTARPMRSPEKFYTHSLEWARQANDVTLESGTYIDWEDYRQHVLSIGTDETEAREWYKSRTDWRVTKDGASALIGAAHFQFSAKKSILQQFVPFNMNRPMGQVRLIDEQLNAAGYLRLCTTAAYVQHMGNRTTKNSQPPLHSFNGKTQKKLSNIPVVRKPLLWIYDRIFKLYNQ